MRTLQKLWSSTDPQTRDPAMLQSEYLTPANVSGTSTPRFDISKARCYGWPRRCIQLRSHAIPTTAHKINRSIGYTYFHEHRHKQSGYSHQAIVTYFTPYIIRTTDRNQLTNRLQLAAEENNMPGQTTISSAKRKAPEERNKSLGGS